MYGLIYGAILSALLCNVVATDAESVAFQNKLAACMTVKAAKTLKRMNLVSVGTSFRLYELKNAVLKCFQEHIHQINCSPLLAPFDSQQVRKRMRA